MCNHCGCRGAEESAEKETFEARFNENGTIAYRYEPEWVGNQGGYPNRGAVFLGRLGGKDYYFVDGFIVQKIRGLKNEVLVQPIIAVRDLYLIDNSTSRQRQDPAIIRRGGASIDKITSQT